MPKILASAQWTPSNVSWPEALVFVVVWYKAGCSVGIIIGGVVFGLRCVWWWQGQWKRQHLSHGFCRHKKYSFISLLSDAFYGHSFV